MVSRSRQRPAKRAQRVRKRNRSSETGKPANDFLLPVGYLISMRTNTEFIAGQLSAYAQIQEWVTRTMAGLTSKMPGKTSQRGRGANAAARTHQTAIATAGKRTLTAKARARIAAAQRKRWALYHEQQAMTGRQKPATTGRKKLKVMAAGRVPF
jgi:hypothetical protein